MIDVREVLRRWQAGQSARQIDTSGVADRKTVKRYLDAAAECGLDKASALSDEIVAAIAQKVQERPAVEPSDEWTELENRRERIEGWLEQDEPLVLTRVHELLVREGVKASYRTLVRFAHRELDWRERAPTVRVNDSAPGEEAQVDFGQMGYVQVPGDERRRLWALIITLTFSRYMFVWPTFTQTLGALCAGLDGAWRFFGGVVQWIIPDNMAAAVMRAHPTAPQLNRSFAEYAQARGFFVDLARARHPKDKPRVENQVPYVRERWFAGETFAMALREIQLHAEVWCRDTAGARIHGTTRQVPREAYEREEHPKMLPAPETPFDVPVWTKAKIHPDHHAQVARGLYSLPTRFIGETLDVRIDSSRVRFYVGAEVVKSHGRVAPGQRSTDENDYPAEKAGYAFRNVDRLRAQAKERGEHVGIYAERLLSGALPWTKMRQAYALIRLCDKFGAARVNSTCASALAFDVIDVPRIERMLKSAHRVEESAAAAGRVARLPEGRFARDRSSFATIERAATTNEKGGDR